MASEPRVAIAHDYLTQRGGAERVVLALTRIFPEAPVYTTLFEPSGTFPEFSNVDVRVSPLNRVGFMRRHHRAALPLLRYAIRRLPVDADVVIASSSGWAHGVPTRGHKVAYCYSPARWLYQGDRYLGDDASVAQRAALAVLGGSLRRWDRRAAGTVDRYLAISTAVQHRVRDVYGLPAEVVAAPHSMDASAPQEPVLGPDGRELDPGYYLVLSRLLPYKNVDKVIDAVRGREGTRLVVVGTGPEEERLRAALPSNAVMVKNLTDAQLRWLYARSFAVVSASHEDFGLTPLEAGSFGRPSVVLRWGGFLDTVLEDRTGVFFDEPTAQSIRGGMDRAERLSWDAAAITARSEQFSEAVFAEHMRAVVAEVGGRR